MECSGPKSICSEFRRKTEVTSGDTAFQRLAVNTLHCENFLERTRLKLERSLGQGQFLCEGRGYDHVCLMEWSRRKNILGKFWQISDIADGELLGKWDRERIQSKHEGGMNKNS